MLASILDVIVISKHQKQTNSWHLFFLDFSYQHVFSIVLSAGMAPLTKACCQLCAILHLSDFLSLAAACVSLHVSYKL